MIDHPCVFVLALNPVLTGVCFLLYYPDIYKKKSRFSKKSQNRLYSLLMAERQGFEPWMEVSPHTRLAG